MDKVGKKTPVWKNFATGEVCCGSTLYVAIGVSPFARISDNWMQVHELPKVERVVIHDGGVLPRNPITEYVAANASTKGTIVVPAYGREYTYNITYVDDVKVIVD